MDMFAGRAILKLKQSSDMLVTGEKELGPWDGMVDCGHAAPACVALSLCLLVLNRLEVVRISYRWRWTAEEYILELLDTIS